VTAIVEVSKVGKRFRLGTRAAYGSLRESIMRLVRAPFASADPGAELWALKDVSFELAAGTALGIVGRNGAGKTTLLKILSRVTEPTEGEVRIRGRIGSLLEVGTGFHPELTGRENVYLNGAILGMKRAELARRFDQIVAFAEVERFLDTPVKHFSAGMRARLGFAVAAHLDPDVLIVDEVLAVGDASFQKRCLAKMEDVGQEGRTVVFVSHDMSAVTRLCRTALLLEGGKLVASGPVSEVVSRYLVSELGTTAAREWPADRAPGNEVVRLRAVRIRDEGKDLSESIDIRHEVAIEIEFEVLVGGRVLVPNFHVSNQDGVMMFVAIEADPEWRRKPRPEGRYVTSAWIPGNFFAEGRVIVGAAISTMDPVHVHFFERDAVAFQVVDVLDGDTARQDYGGPIPGVVRPKLRWTTRAP
jgi:lipopolysaccharide transport system ATP-binding protein